MKLLFSNWCCISGHELVKQHEDVTSKQELEDGQAFKAKLVCAGR